MTFVLIIFGWQEDTYMKLGRIAENFHRPRMGRRLAALLASQLIMGICVAVFKTIGFGTDPCSTFTLGVAAHTGISFGTCQFTFNLLLFLPVIFLDLSRIGIGTVINMVGVGYTADICMRLIGAHMPAGGLSIVMRIVLFVAAMTAFLIAVGFYVAVDLGVAPYDAIPQLITAHTDKLSGRTIRMLWDLSYLVIGFLLGSTVGLTTVISGFCLGPAIAFVSGRVKNWFE